VECSEGFFERERVIKVWGIIRARHPVLASEIVEEDVEGTIPRVYFRYGLG
jgi:hypothetical protein